MESVRYELLLSVAVCRNGVVPTWRTRLKGFDSQWFLLEFQLGNYRFVLIFIVFPLHTFGFDLCRLFLKLLNFSWIFIMKIELLLCVCSKIHKSMQWQAQAEFRRKQNVFILSITVLCIVFPYMIYNRVSYCTVGGSIHPGQFIRCPLKRIQLTFSRLTVYGRPKPQTKNQLHWMRTAKKLRWVGAPINLSNNFSSMMVRLYMH